jgi:hypothetical protein
MDQETLAQANTLVLNIECLEQHRDVNHDRSGAPILSLARTSENTRDRIMELYRNDLDTQIVVLRGRLADL